MYNGVTKLPRKKLIEIIILIIVLLWILLFTVNYFRYTRDEPPLFAIHFKNTCDDGVVNTYSSFGYTYRKYESTSLNQTEFVPFWIPQKKCALTYGLPQTYKDYSIPNNPKYKPNYRGLVYLYVGRTNLIGAYKCVNSEDKCTLATSGVDDFNIRNTDKLLALSSQPNMAVVYDRYGFIDDSIQQDDKKKDGQYVRTIYYYDARKNVIIDRFADVKHSLFNKYKYGIGHDNDYIVRDYDSRKWGLVHFNEDGTYDNILEFEYDSINYNVDTGFYILGKDDKWSVYDIDNDAYIIKDYEGVIYDFWENNNMSYYYKTGSKNKSEDGEEYYSYAIYKVDGGVLLDVPNVASVVHTRSLIMYWKYDDNTLHFMDYVQNDRVQPVQLYFKELDNGNNHFNPSFEYDVEEGDGDTYVMLKVFKERKMGSNYYRYRVNSAHWK